MHRRQKEKVFRSHPTKFQHGFMLLVEIQRWKFSCKVLCANAVDACLCLNVNSYLTMMYNFRIHIQKCMCTHMLIGNMI